MLEDINTCIIQAIFEFPLPGDYDVAADTFLYLQWA